MKNFKKIVALALVFVMAMTGLVACGKSPKETVMDALATLSSGASVKGLADELGITEIMKKVEEGSFTVGMEAGLDIPDDGSMAVAGVLASSTIKAEMACDTDANKALLGLGVNVAGSDIFQDRFMWMKSSLQLRFPSFWTKYFMLNLTILLRISRSLHFLV